VRGYQLAAERDDESDRQNEQMVISEESATERQEWRQRRSADGASTSRRPSLTDRLRQAWNAALRRWPLVMFISSHELISNPIKTHH
jgi:hypothetical protein